MSFSNPNVKISYDGNGVDDRFGINFYYLEGNESFIVAELWDYTDSLNPVKLPFVSGLDYAIDASSYPNTEVVTVDPVPVNHKIFIYRKSSNVQESSFASGAFPAESIEETFDRLAMVSQEQAEILTRTLTSELGGVPINNQDVLDAVALLPRVEQNESDIAQNIANIATNTSNIATASSQINGLGVQVTNNTNNISQAQSDIGDLQTDVGTLQTDVGTAQSDISTLQGQVGSLTPDTVVNIIGAVTHNAVNKEIIIVETNGAVDVVLPTPTIGHKIVVKMGSDVSNKTISTADGIDGFGLVYTVSSTYEAVTLIANGTQWYIL